ncbi:Tripartite-type tricarboxylate transporter, receptor component TctC [Falsiroseomonas stagni DSM 19981]|uniref:Tripartite-type tricarboxylate transporter, receptor component TctC n=2 Tax=Falsiroseomonas TaxID=2870713 RepID=A0A1I4ACL9_9PROT|nr:Tripartite-type tricarboxylate transporter, receptor component TctC [Falsiroseomonas stagni DSM 19981]
MNDAMKRRTVLAAAAGVLGAAPGARAQAAFPARQVQIVVPFPPGGATDLMARLLVEPMTRSLGQSVIVENRAGATGAIGAQAVARAPADGHTILMGTASVNSVLTAVRPDVGYDTLRDFAPILLVASFPNMLVVHPSVPATSIAELVALLRRAPDSLTFASSGIGSSVHLAGELFKLMTGTQMTHVPYRGSAPAVTDLLAGRVSMMFDNMTTVLPHVQRGQLRALGVTGRERSSMTPEVPAIAETLAGYDATSWVGLMAPARTPDAVVQRLAADARDALAQPVIANRMRELGADIGGGSPQDFVRFLEEDVAKWRRVVRDAGVKPE